MRSVRRVCWAGMAAAGAACALGLALAIRSAITAGDWNLAPMPWIGVGMTLVSVGLAGAAAFGLLLVVLEPLGWWRLLVVPPALIVVGFWLFVLVVGVPTSGGPDDDVATILYSMPSLLAILIVVTAALAIAPIAGRRSRAASG